MEYMRQIKQDDKSNQEAHDDRKMGARIHIFQKNRNMNLKMTPIIRLRQENRGEMVRKIVSFSLDELFLLGKRTEL